MGIFHSKQESTPNENIIDEIESDAHTYSQNDSSNVLVDQPQKIDQQNFEKIIDDEEHFYFDLISYLENPENTEYDLFYIVDNNIKQILEDREKIKKVLQLITKIANNHHRDENLFKNIFNIIQNYTETIKESFSNYEIFDIFKSNKLILLFLFSNKTIFVDDKINEIIISKIEKNGNRYCHFFYPEIKDFNDEEIMKGIEEELLSIDINIFDNFNEKRQKGENESYICSLIRQDSIQEFVSYTTKLNIRLDSTINLSIFETNSFLNKLTKVTLIQYAAFFGSIQIVQFLRMNDVELEQSLWLYAIHSNNAEMIHFLESNMVSQPGTNYLECFTESVKCHHNEIANYIRDNFLFQQKKPSSEQKEEIIENCIKYFNYAHFQKDLFADHGFFYLCKYGFNELVDVFIKMKEDEYENKIINILMISES